MIAYILYNKDSSDREVTNFAGRLDSLQVEHKLVEADSLEGIRLTENYDLTARPAVALVKGDGTLVERWLGTLPLVEDVSYLAHA